jgi:hypothetical protein
MNPAIDDEALHGFASDFAADGVKAGEQDCTGRVVDEDGDASGSFEGADVSALAADDAALNIVALEGNGGGGIFEGVFAGVALNGNADDAAGLFFGFGFGFVEDVAGEIAGIAQGFLLDALEKFGFGFFHCEARGALQGFAVLAGELIEGAFDLFDGFGSLAEGELLLLQSFFGLNDTFELGVDEPFAFAEAAFEFGAFGAAGGEGGLGFLAQFASVFVRSQAGVANDDFSFVASFGKDGFGFEVAGFAHAAAF